MFLGMSRQSRSLWINYTMEENRRTDVFFRQDREGRLFSLLGKSKLLPIVLANSYGMGEAIS